MFDTMSHALGLTEGAERLLDKSLLDYQAREAAWWKNDRRGRWVVLEPGPGRLLTDSPNTREYVDAVVPQRGRRFRSLSRARSFAREIGSEVRHFRKTMPRKALGKKFKARWRYETNPWKRAIKPMIWGRL